MTSPSSHLTPLSPTLRYLSVGRRPHARRGQWVALLTVALLLCGTATAQAQRTQKKQAEPTRTIVDDESCGCELTFVDGIQTIERDGLFGFKLEDGTLLVEPKYKYVDEFKEGFCVVMSDETHFGLINRAGREVVPCDFEHVSTPTEGLVRVQRDGLFGFMDTAGREVIPPTWRAASGFYEGLATVAVDIDSLQVAYGFVDRRGKLVIQAQYDYAYPFHEGVAVVKQYERYGMIDHSGREVVPIKYLELSSSFHGRCFAVDAQTERMAMLTTANKQLTDFCYDEILGLGDKMFSVRRGNVETFLDLRGRERHGEYDHVGIYADGRVMVSRDGKYGILDLRGRKILPIEYDNYAGLHGAYTYSEGLALVARDGRCGYVDRRGRIVVPLQYIAGGRFAEGRAPVQWADSRNWGYIDQEGRTVVPPVFETAADFRFGRAEVVYRSEAYKIDPSGRCIKNCRTFPHHLYTPRP